MQISDEIRSRWPVLAIFLLLCVAAISGIWIASERREARKLAAANESLNASVTRMQNELQSLTTKLNNALETREAPAPPRPVARPRSAPQTRRAPKPAPEDPRWSQIRNQLANQQKEIASTKEDLGKAREELH